jgi:plastocyanin
MRVRPFFWFFFAGVCIGVLIFAALLQPGAPVHIQAQRSPGSSAATTSTCGTGAVYALASTFKESCVEVAKGGQLQIVPAGQTLHILDAGSWVGGKPVPMNEPDVSSINNVRVTAMPVSIGPFTVAGTFYIYCTLHPNMNLTIMVQ